MSHWPKFRRNEGIYVVKKNLKEGDLVITLPQITSVKSIQGKLKEGMMGVIVETSANFDSMNVFGVIIDGQVYYLFEDEIEKVEKKC
jgi:hypothetical protein